MKELKRDSIVFQVAYFFHYENNIPGETNICGLVWNFFLAALTLLILALAAFLLIYPAALLLCGYKPSANRRRPFAPIGTNWWPTIRGKRIWPLWLWIVAGWSFLYWQVVIEGSERALVVGIAVIFLTITTAIIVGATLLCKRAWRSEVMDLVRAYVRAKKERICPIVEIEPA